MSENKNELDDELDKLTMNDIDKLNDEEIDKLMNNDIIINKIRKKIICSECKTDNGLVEDNTQGIIVCNKCGLVVANLVSENIETKIYEDKDGSYKSTATNVMFPQSSLGTTIKGRGGKLRMIQNWNAMPYGERSLYRVFKEIQFRCEKGKILKCIEQDAKIMYKIICENKHGKNKRTITRGINRKSLIAACIFVACRKRGMTRSLTEISKLFEIEYTQLTKGCKNFIKFISKCPNIDMDIGTSKPEHFVIRYCNILKLPPFAIDYALKIVKNIKKINIATSHTPISIAIACIIIN
jgi:transcription initiation factor TFIIB